MFQSDSCFVHFYKTDHAIWEIVNLCLCFIHKVSRIFTFRSADCGHHTVHQSKHFVFVIPVAETLDLKKAARAAGVKSIAMLPQPFVTVAQTQLPDLRVALDLTEEWDALDNGSALLTGVVVARADFVKEHPAAVSNFLEQYSASVDWVNANTADAAALIGEYSIVDAAVAEKALPYCNIVCLMGANLLEALPGYLEVLYNASPAAVGGEMPDNSFYFA